MRLPSRIRALILISTVLDLRRLGRLVRASTKEPRVEQIELAGVPVELVRPGGEAQWPAWVFINGAHPERRREPMVTRLSRGLARAGYVVFVPDVPGLGEGTITTETLAAACAVTKAATEHQDVLRGRVALIGASTGAALALLTAAQDDLRERVSVVAAVAPFADLTRMVCLATTRSYEENGGFVLYPVTPLHRRVVARSLAATVTDDSDRRRLLDSLANEDDDQDPIALMPSDLKTPEAQTIVAVLRNEHPDRFIESCEALHPRAKELLARLSPLEVCPNVSAPVEIVVPPSDVYFPLGEAQALAAALPNAHLTVTATLDHTRPHLSIAHLRSLRRFDRFVVRGLRAAAT